MDKAILALEEHLGNTGCHTEVAVDLERRMCIEQIGEGAAIGIFSLHTLVGKNAQHIADDLERMVAILHARPEIGLPTKAPTCGLIAALLECLACCGKQGRSACSTDLI